MDLKDPNNMESNQNTVLITGINRGLGKELFQLFTSRGYRVFGVVRNKREAKRLKTELPSNSSIILTDLATDESIETIQKAVGETPINLVINNAGIGGNSHLMDEIETDEFIGLFNIHCLGVFRTVKALKSNLLHANNPVVLNLNSRLGSITRQSNGTYDDLTVSYSYRIAKASQNMLTTCLRKEFEGAVKFLSIHPGKMKTEIAQVDADVEPKEVALKFINHYESGRMNEANGIIELDKEIIEW